MSGYRVMYALGVTPWEVDEPPLLLRAFLEAPDAPPPASALDLGCGTGADAVYLARRGWTVTAVDVVPKALAAAKERAEQAGVDVQWVRGSVADLDRLPLRPPYGLITDMGCFHGLRPSKRVAYAAGVTGVAAPDATLLMLAVDPGRRGPAPHGTDAEQLRSLFGASWHIEQPVPATDVELDGGPLRNAVPSYYTLRRR